MPFDPNKPKPTPPNNDDNTKPNDKPNKPNDGDNNPSKPQPKPPVTPDKPNPSQPTPPNSNDNTKPNKPDNSSSDDNTKPNDDNSNPNNGGSGNDFGTSNNSLIKPGGSTTETTDNNSSCSGKNDNSGKGNNDNNSNSGSGGNNDINGSNYGDILGALNKINKNIDDIKFAGNDKIKDIPDFSNLNDISNEMGNSFDNFYTENKTKFEEFKTFINSKIDYIKNKGFVKLGKNRVESCAYETSLKFDEFSQFLKIDLCEWFNKLYYVFYFLTFCSCLFLGFKFILISLFHFLGGL